MNKESEKDLSARKSEHLSLAERSQAMSSRKATPDFWDYEPLFSQHGDGDFKNNKNLRCEFLGKSLAAPLWISSMTGGTGEAGPINRQLARVAHEFELGFALGSCRPLLAKVGKAKKVHFEDFNLRPILGPNLPFYANIGIAQVEELLRTNELGRLSDLVAELSADGLIVHINPIQEALQPEGDRFLRPPIETLSQLCLKKQELGGGLIVKEVGQGFGPRSLRALMELPLDAIEFGAYGGTNFGQLELLRHQFLEEDTGPHPLTPIVSVGHTAFEMVSNALELGELLKEKAICQNFIISGGISSFLDGYALVKKMRQKGHTAVYGQAYSFLKHAKGPYNLLRKYVEAQLHGLDLCERFLNLKE